MILKNCLTISFGEYMVFTHFLFITFEKIKEIIIEKIKEVIVEILERILHAIQNFIYVNL
ncbi:hypothetical protein AC481_02415 [miscellaneous Crenarchaeota group archaeon SMTZ-80]|nr:MAG: hypothetical protein AC481_02415 [miscellaneous Crenarchaeota group archaeon SMTZ-80]